MATRQSPRNGLIAAERRRRIYGLALERGSVNVTDVARELGVNPDTIRRDLDGLHKEGKLIRSHGGAIAIDTEVAHRPYSALRGENLQMKAWIGQAAIKCLPETGSVFIGAGSTTYQLAMNMPEDWQGHIITGSPEIAVYLASARGVSVGLLGGNIRMDSYASDCSWSEHILDMASWDVTFLGASAVDVERGIGAVDVNAALMEYRIIGHGNKLVLLCDSSKFGGFAYARVGSVDLIDVLITDNGVSQVTVDELTTRGIKVVVAGPDGIESVNGGVAS